MSKRITRKIYKTTSKPKRHKTKRHKTNKYRPRKYYLFGGNSNVHREQFRNMFIKNLKKLKLAIKENNETAISEILMSFANGFNSNRLGINYRIFASINTLEPLDKATYSRKEYHDSNVAIFSCLVLILANITDNAI